MEASALRRSNDAGQIDITVRNNTIAYLDGRVTDMTSLVVDQGHNVVRNVNLEAEVKRLYGVEDHIQERGSGGRGAASCGSGSGAAAGPAEEATVAGRQEAPRQGHTLSPSMTVFSPRSTKSGFDQHGGVRDKEDGGNRNIAEVAINNMCSSLHSLPRQTNGRQL